MFELFDRQRDYSVRNGHLPHWYQAGVTYFVTFRTEDSVPQPLVRAWRARRDEWLREHDIDPRFSGWKTKLENSAELAREYANRFTRQFLAYLDRGLGASPLRNSEAAGCVAEALRHFDEERYLLGDFVVMPNHVHVLVCLLENTEIEAQCQSWKRRSATEINRLLNRKGRLWQEESFDHLVRSPEQFEYFRRYIAANPIRAKLRTSEYLHWQRPVE